MTFFEPRVRVPELFSIPVTVTLVGAGALGVLGTLLPWWGIDGTNLSKNFTLSYLHNYDGGSVTTVLFGAFAILVAVGIVTFFRRTPIPGRLTFLISIFALVGTAVGYFTSHSEAFGIFVKLTGDTTQSPVPSIGLFMCLSSSIVATTITARAAIRQRTNPS